MNVFNLSQDDLKDFASPKKFKRQKSKAKKRKALSENHSSNQKSAKILQSKSLNSEDTDLIYPCSTCGKPFGILELFNHAPKCLELNTTAVVHPECSYQSKTCPVCNKTFMDLNESQLNWHINKCIDRQNPKNVLSPFVSETFEKKKLQSTILNNKYFKIPKSRFAQDILTAKALCASEKQFNKDNLKRNKLSKKDKIPSMIQYSPESLKISKDIIVQKLILDRASNKGFVKNKIRLPPYKNILLNRNFLTLSLSYQVKDIKKVDLFCINELEELYKVN